MEAAVTKFDEGITYPPNGDESRVSANVRLIGENGADIQLTVRIGATVEEVVGVLGVMAKSLAAVKEKYHLTPAPARNGRSGASANGDAPVCKVHNKPMKRSQHFNGWYCPRKSGDDYCKEKVMD